MGGNARDGHHCEAAVLQFTDLHLVHVLLAQAQRIEGEVTRLAAFAQLAVGNDAHVLKDGNPDEDLDETALGHGSVVGLERRDAEDGVVEIGEDPARSGEHGNAAVLELSLMSFKCKTGVVWTIC